MLYNTIKNNKHTNMQSNAVFSDETDIVIVGTGTAGAIAAICAAEKGLRVIAVDKATIPGGVAVASGVWAYYYGLHAGREEQLNRRAEELIKTHGYSDYSRVEYETNTCIPSAPKCIAIEEALTAAGCKLWLDSIVTGVYTDSERVIGLEILSGGNLKNVRCRAVIDSADGEICRLAGCAFKKGRKYDNSTMRFSKCIATADGNKVRPVWANYGYIDNLPNAEYSNRILEAASAPPCLIDKYDENNCVIFEGSIICRREVRSINTLGEYTLDDYFNGKLSECPVYYSFSHMDNSNPDMENEDENIQDWQIVINVHTYGVAIGVDMNCLISKEYKNLFVAGKHIGIGHDLVGCIRMKADIEKCGEAAALMAVLYIQNGEVRYEDLKPLLINRGLLQERHRLNIATLNEQKDSLYIKTNLPKELTEISAALSSQSPELALLYIKQHSKDQKLIRFLTENLKTGDMILRHNSAIALGLIGNKECTDTLCEIISMPAYVLEKHDFKPYHYDWLNDTYHCNTLKALCLLKRFDNIPCLDIVQNIYDDKAENITRELPPNLQKIFRPQIMAFAKKLLDNN